MVTLHPIFQATETRFLVSIVIFFLIFSDQAKAVSADTTATDSGAEEVASRIGIPERPAFADSLRLPSPQNFPSARPFLRKPGKLRFIDDPQVRTETERDSLGNYITRKTIHGFESGFPSERDFRQYSTESLDAAIGENWSFLIQEAERRRETRRGLLDFTIQIPGGEGSAFTTIFGRPEVNLRVTGTANMNVGATISNTEDPSLQPDQRTRVDPLFNQNLQLNIQGTIGDKLFIRTDWDTERSFNYQNRLSIVYEGYDDEIIQRIEMGNVSMDTGNSLVRGGSALFGIKTEAKFGPLTLTSVVSQQEGSGETQTISGGSQETKFDIRPTSYNVDRHFFIDFFAFQEFENSMADPNSRINLFGNIERIDVYIQNIQGQAVEGQRRAMALVDRGVNEQNGVYFPPNQDNDRFDEATLDQFRDASTGVSASDLGVDSDEFEEGFFIRLVEGVDYTLDEYLGIIHLNTRLNDRQALAISYTYNGQQGRVDVGDINLGDNDRMVLKLLRPSNLSSSSKAWPLMLRNVYSLNATNLNRENIEMDIVYTGTNTDQTNLPNLGNILLRDLGLDRVNSQGELGPDNQVDFGTGTLNAAQGRIMFPYLQPFGNRIREIYENSNLSDAEKEEAIERYVFEDLYTTTQSNAQQSSRDNIYRIKGTTRGGTQDSYYLGFSLVEGSVRVRANGVELVQGNDYEVDYSLGNILITNPRYLSSGQEIQIEYESNQILQIQQTTLTGVRAEYEVNDNIKLGSTYFRLRERPLQDKIPVGEEPINNSVVGFDARAQFDAPWLTRAIDWVPLLQTRAESRITLSGEFAQLNPDVAQTSAVSRAIDQDRLFSDEERGLSFIDDFEGSKRTVSFLSPSRWHLAAAPHAVPGYDVDMESSVTGLPARIERSDLRGKFSWYQINLNVQRRLGVDPANFPETRPVEVTDVFPNRDVRPQENRLQTLDIYYNPRKRGPYMYNMDLRNLLENEPERLWGGMTTTLPSGLDNLRQSNIEFIEFWIQPLLPEGREPNPGDIENYNGKIYIDLGTVNEDVIPNNRLNTEDGVGRARTAGRSVVVGPSGRSYIQRDPQDLTGVFVDDNASSEDIGLDGAHSTEGEQNEQILFAEFLDRMRDVYADQPDKLQEIINDPSNDQFTYFENSSLAGLPLNKRYHRMYPYLEGNYAGVGENQPITNRPDTEGLINPATVNLEDSYFQFEIPINPADTSSMRLGENFIVDKVDGPRPENRWYLVRIPLREYARKVGNIEDLERVTHMRMWMSGYREPFTMRFATYELVGNDWRAAPELSEVQNPSTIFEIATINIEENADRSPIPYRMPTGAIRSQQRGQAEITQENEQSLQLNTEDLRSEDIRFIRRSYTGGLNLLNYSNMRMFVHGEGFEKRGDVELVLRFGNDLTDNYYEYRQPITPTDPNYPFRSYSELDNAQRMQEEELIWLPDSNSVNIVLGVMNQLKQARDIDQVEISDFYERSDLVVDGVPGAIVGIKGNPSLSRVTEFAIGLRNPHPLNGDGERRTNPNAKPSLDAEVWVNELRVSGFEDQSGWAANVRGQIQLADFATINANLNKSTDGFGSLDSRLGDRQMSERQSLDLSTTINLHRFVPERYGWNFPLTLSMRQNESTPRFLPREGDIRFQDFQNAILGSDQDETTQRNLIDAKLLEIQTYSENYSLNLSNISKRNSESRITQLLLDNTQLSYVYNTSNSRDPNNIFNDGWNYRTGINYRLNVSNVNMVRPFWYLEDVPVLRHISDVGFAYLPSSVTTSATLDRRYNESQRRNFGDQDPFNIQQTHNFDLRNTFGFNYNLSQTITTSFSSSTSFNLANIGIQEIDEETGEFRIIPTFDVFEDIISVDTISARRSDYQESYSITWRPRLSQISALDWFNYSASYRGQFRWNNAPEGSGLGATLANSYNLDQSPEIRVQTLLKKISWYDDAFSADEQALRDRQRARQQARQQREREREERRRAQEGEATEESPANNRQVNRRATPQQQTQPEQEEDGFNLNEEIRFYGRRAIMAALSIQNLNISYSNSGSSSQAGYAGSPEIWYMFNESNAESFSPEFRYRVGLTNELPITDIVRPDDPERIFDFNQRNTQTDNITIRSGLRPFRDINIDLDWNRGGDVTDATTFRVFPDSITTTVNQSGNVNASVWAFGGGYDEFFRSQLQRAFNQIDGSTDIISDDASNILLSSSSLETDFRNSYVGIGSGPIGDRGFLPLPLPNWRVTWSGWERRFDFLSRVLNRASLTHSYSGRYRLGWALNLDEGDEVSRNVGAYRLTYPRPKYQARSINIERRFNPVIGMNLTWTNNLRTNIQYDHSTVTSFSPANNNISENTSQGIRITANYSKRGFQLPFLQRFSNQVDLQLTMAYLVDSRETFRLNQDLADVLEAGPDQLVRDVSLYSPGIPDVQGDRRIQITPTIGYQFSQTVKASFEYSYRQLIPKASNIFPRVDQDIRFNIVVSIRSN